MSDFNTYQFDKEAHESALEQSEAAFDREYPETSDDKFDYSRAVVRGEVVLDLTDIA